MEKNLAKVRMAIRPPPCKSDPEGRSEGRNVEWRPPRLPCSLRKVCKAIGSLQARVNHHRSPLPCKIGLALMVLLCTILGLEQ